jgi:hypothetical protein|tara:strand:+ start:205 stop:462 length:258 start_codon:yes stop_codon:yes gene_type:complete
MPKVKTKNGFRYFPYTKAGKKAAEKLRYKLRKKKQGYKAREDESLGMRLGKQSTKKQSKRARRDESYGAWGKRKPKFGRLNKVNK